MICIGDKGHGAARAKDQLQVSMSRNSPALGVQVTIVWRDGLRYAEVCGHQFRGSFHWSDGERNGFVEDEDEGVHWTRGWLQEHTEEARALLAAHKLARSQET